MSYRGITGNVKAETNGVSAIFESREGTDDDIVIDEIWRENVYRLERHHVEGGAVLDIGGNIGVFSTLCAKYGATHIYTYEPLETNYAQIVKHLDSTGVKYSATCAAVSSVTGEVGFYNNHPEHTGGGSTNVTPQRGDVSVPSYSFKDVLDSVGPISLLKMDIEGGEYECFKCIEASDLAQVDRITMEFHPGSKHDFGDLVTKLAEWGHVETLGKPSLGGQIYAHRYNL